MRTSGVVQLVLQIIKGPILKGRQKRRLPWDPNQKGASNSFAHPNQTNKLIAGPLLLLAQGTWVCLSRRETVLAPARGCKGEVELSKWVGETEKKRRHKKIHCNTAESVKFFTVSVTKRNQNKCQRAVAAGARDYGRVDRLGAEFQRAS